MEERRLERVFDGAHTEAYNSRGVVMREEGGKQERELAAKYREWSKALRVSHPFVSTHLLLGLANTYDRQGQAEDVTSKIRRRMRSW